MSSTIRRMLGIAAAAVAAVVLLAPAGGAAPAQPSEPPTTATVLVDDNFFKPKKLKVTVPAEVTWKWVGFVAHNVVVKKGPEKFKSKIQSEGRFTREIDEPGVYRIVCTLHPGMKMKLTAVESPLPSSATTVPPAT